VITKLRAYLLFSILLSFSLLAVGFYSKGYWVVFPLLAGIFTFGFFTRRTPAEWPSMVLLGVVLFAAAAGVLRGVSQWMVLSAGVVALAAWDLNMLYKRVKIQPASPGLEQLINKHVQTLFFAVALGWLLALLGSGIHLRFPFAIMALLVLIIFFGLDRLVHGLNSN